MYLICSALVPSTRALSYLVMYGVVVLLAAGMAWSASERRGGERREREREREGERERENE